MENVSSPTRSPLVETIESRPGRFASHGRRVTQDTLDGLSYPLYFELTDESQRTGAEPGIGADDELTESFFEQRCRQVEELPPPLVHFFPRRCNKFISKSCISMHYAKNYGSIASF